jgi:hypothetical protein
MNNILIIGKNSHYYNQIKVDLKKYFKIVEISHNELSNNTTIRHFEWDCILIFARVENINFFNVLKNNFVSKKFVLISSIILDLPEDYKYYSYYNEKFNVEKWFTSFFNTNNLIIRSGTIENDSVLIFSKKIDFINIIRKIDYFNNIYSLPLYKKNYKIPHLFYRIIFHLPYGYIFTRPLDIIYKYSKGYVYGYIYAIDINFNQLNKNC